MNLKKLIPTNFFPKTQNARKLSLASLKSKKAVASKSEVKLSWDRAVEDAIKCVNYQSPFLKLSYMTTDKNVNWFKNLEKLDQSGHPMNHTTSLRYIGKANANQLWGIITLLVSKLAEYSLTYSWRKGDFDRATGILYSQRNLADYTEFVATGNDFHRDGIQNMQHLYKAGTDLDSDSQMIFGNKMAILAGDMLLGYSSLQIAKLRNDKITELWGTSARDNVDFNFLGDRDIQNNPLPSDPIKKLKVQKQNPKIFEEVSSDQIDLMLPFKSHDVMGTAEKEWKIRHTLGGASRLGKSCQAALILAKHDEEKQKEAYFMGKHMYLSYRAAKDLSIFRSNEIPSNGKFLLISAPLLFHLEEDPSLYEEIKKGSKAIENIDFAEVHEIVRNGSGMEKTKELLSENMSIALNLLYKFPKSESRSAIENLILALGDCSKMTPNF